MQLRSMHEHRKKDRSQHPALVLNCFGTQLQSKIWFILPTREANHIIREANPTFCKETQLLKMWASNICC